MRANRLAQQAGADQPDADPERHLAAGKHAEQTDLHNDIRPKAPREYSTSVIANATDFCLRPRGGLPPPQERRSGEADTLAVAEEQ
jgi:hypothetical protein